MKAVSGFVLLALTACPPPNPGPVPPDATDAAPIVVSDAGPSSSDAPAPQTPCSAACSTLSKLGCPVEPDCVTVMAHIDGAHLIRTSSGTFMTCTAVASATSKAGVAALGVSCP
jgi:hypothetical protein